MSLVWGMPIALAALAALLVPLLLHLDRRRAVRTLPFAAMRWIVARRRPRRTWRLTEWLLLVLRLALVACLALWLAQPLLRGWGTGVRWLAIMPGMAASEIASAAGDADRVVWLAPGFPARDRPPPAEHGAIASLLRELDTRLAPDDQLCVLVPTELAGLDAAAIELSHTVDWQISAGSPAAPSATAAPRPGRLLALRYSDAADASLPFVRAAVASWAQTASLAVELDEGMLERALPKNIDALIWLGNAPDVAALALAGSGAALLHIPSSSSASDAAASIGALTAWPPPAQRLGRGRQLHLETPLDPRILPELHSAEFPGMLHRTLFGDAPPPSRAYAEDVHPRRVIAADSPRETSLRPWFAWVIAALFLLERVLANGRRLGNAT